MAKHKSPFRKAIDKIIVELDRAHIARMEDAQPLESVELALEKAHQLLRVPSVEKAKERLGPVSLSHYFGNIWLDAWPDVAARVEEAQRLLDES